MDKNKVMHDLKESNLKAKILLQMIAATSSNEQSNLERNEQIKQLIEELEKSLALTKSLS